MKTVLLTLFSIKDISNHNYANLIMKVLERHNLLPERIGLFQPVKEDFSFERAAELWETKAGSGDFYRGELVGNRKSPNISYSFSWYKAKNPRVNTISIFFNGSEGFKKNELKVKLLKELVQAVPMVYGYITDFAFDARQSIPGTILTRLPGIFWCNFFGQQYRDFLGEKLLRVNWAKVENHESGLLTFLTAEPNSDEISSGELEKKAREIIGIEYFGDFEAYRKDVDSKQITVAPEFDLRELYI